MRLHFYCKGWKYLNNLGSVSFKNKNHVSNYSVFLTKTSTLHVIKATR